jgi:hypothetical protein
MNPKNERPIYRIIYIDQEERREIYAQFISEETLVGFIEADNLLDPQKGYSNNFVKESRSGRCYIPLHNIVRIDEVILKTSQDAKDNISQFPHAFKKSVEKE